MKDRLAVIPGITVHPPFIRDAGNRGAIFNLWLLALLPCVAMGLWNTGYQANLIMQAMDMAIVPGWRGFLLSLVGNAYQPDSFWDNITHGVVYFLPILAAALVSAIFWEAIFARLRRRPVTEGTMLLSLLFALILPPNIPLWQVVVGMSFAVVIGKEVFGGTGLYLVHPVLAGRAFLYFAYPDQLTGDTIWTTVDAVVGATPLATVKAGGTAALLESGISTGIAFFGQIPGSMGETSTLAILLGAALLLWTRVISWRILAGAVAGLVVTSLLFNAIGSETNGMAMLSWTWHLVLGGFAFGLVFFATDPVVAPTTQAGRWIYGALIGVLLVLIRAGNPALPEGMMFAVLLANVLAPLIDQAVVNHHIRRRRARVTQGFDTEESHG